LLQAEDALEAQKRASQAQEERDLEGEEIEEWDEEEDVIFGQEEDGPQTPSRPSPVTARGRRSGGGGGSSRGSGRGSKRPYNSSATNGSGKKRALGQSRLFDKTPSPARPSEYDPRKQDVGYELVYKIILPHVYYLLGSLLVFVIFFVFVSRVHHFECGITRYITPSWTFTII